VRPRIWWAGYARSPAKAARVRHRRGRLRPRRQGGASRPRVHACLPDSPGPMLLPLALVCANATDGEHVLQGKLAAPARQLRQLGVSVGGAMTELQQQPRHPPNLDPPCITPGGVREPLARRERHLDRARLRVHAHELEAQQLRCRRRGGTRPSITSQKGPLRAELSAGAFARRLMAAHGTRRQVQWSHARAR
jgi:hypothetical protein